HAPSSLLEKAPTNRRRREHQGRIIPSRSITLRAWEWASSSSALGPSKTNWESDPRSVCVKSTPSKRSWIRCRPQTANGSCDVCSCRYARCVLRPSFRLKASYSLRRGPRISLIQALHSCVLSALSGKTKARDSMLLISFFLDPLHLYEPV